MSTGKPLAGLVILDFTRVYSGPYCTMLLADLGAEVIKIEAAGKGDDTRYFYPIKDGESGYFMYLNRNKKSLCLNLKTDEGREIALSLAEQADVVIENFSPGTMARLGLDYEAIRKRNPEVIYGSISGFGQSGPYRNKVAYDGVAQAMGGLMSLTGLPGELPVKTGPAIADAASGVHMATAILAALYYRKESGKGQYIDIAMMDTVFSMLENSVPIQTYMNEPPARVGNANPGSAPYNLYQTKDSHIVIATANDSLFAKLCKVMNREELLEDPRYSTNPCRKRHEKEVDAFVEEWTRQHTSAEIESWLDAAGVPVSSVKTITQLVEDPHLKHRNMLVDIDHPTAGTVRYPGNPVHLSRTPLDTYTHAPLLGQHSEEILKERLQHTDSAIAQLRESGVI